MATSRVVSVARVNDDLGVQSGRLVVVIISRRRATRSRHWRRRRDGTVELPAHTDLVTSVRVHVNSDRRQRRTPPTARPRPRQLSIITRHAHSLTHKMNDLDLCLEVVLRSCHCQPLRHIHHWLSRKPLELKAICSTEPPIGNDLWRIKWSRDPRSHLPVNYYYYYYSVLLHSYYNYWRLDRNFLSDKYLISFVLCLS